ncbi:hypothetical protein MASR2M15_01480 [Anaerolineales bacterium]
MVAIGHHQVEILSPYSYQILFYGDQVRLVGQMDFPPSPPKARGHKLFFTLQHATHTHTKEYDCYVSVAREKGYASFRWDKRGTGRSGSGGLGNPMQDAVNAYQVAVRRTGINPEQVVIFAQNEGSLILGKNLERFMAIQKPKAIILAGNMLDQTLIEQIECPLYIMQGEQDWLNGQEYALKASRYHQEKQGYPGNAKIIQQADRHLMADNQQRHPLALETLASWLGEI